MTDQWLPLMDFAIKRNLSLSTLRRYIKAKKVIYKLENGRYFLLDQSVSQGPVASQAESLQIELQKAREEIAELKMLIAFYEENQSSGQDL